jgi:hypothetical protein
MPKPESGVLEAVGSPQGSGFTPGKWPYDQKPDAGQDDISPYPLPSGTSRQLEPIKLDVPKQRQLDQIELDVPKERIMDQIKITVPKEKERAIEPENEQKIADSDLAYSGHGDDGYYYKRGLPHTGYDMLGNYYKEGAVAPEPEPVGYSRIRDAMAGPRKPVKSRR